MEMETTLRIRKHVIKSAQILLEKMRACFQLLQDHVKDIILDMLTIQRPNLASTSHTVDVLVTITDLSQMMNARLFVLKMI